MSKVKIEPISEHEKQIEISRATKELERSKTIIDKIKKKGKPIFSLSRNGIILKTTDLEKWEQYFNN